MRRHIKIPFVSYFSKKAGQGKQNYDRQEKKVSSNNDSLFISTPGDILNQKEIKENYHKLTAEEKFELRYGEHWREMFI